MGLPLLSVWHCGPSFPFILALWAHFLSFWPCEPSFPFVLALWAFISLHFCLFRVSFWGPSTRCQKSSFLNLPYKEFSSVETGSIFQFWPFGPSFPFILALWAFISFHFGLFRVRFLGSQKWSVFPISHTKNLAAPRPAPFSNFWPFGPSFPFILAFSVAPANCKKWSGARGNQYEGEKKRDFKMTTAHWQGSSDQMLAQVPKYKENECSKASKRHVSTTVSLPRP